MEAWGEQHPRAEERLPTAGREPWTRSSLPALGRANPSSPLIADPPASRTETKTSVV